MILGDFFMSVRPTFNALLSITGFRRVVIPSFPLCPQQHSLRLPTFLFVKIPVYFNKSSPVCLTSDSLYLTHSLVLRSPSALPSQSSVVEVQQGCAVLPAVEAHADLLGGVLIQSRLHRLQSRQHFIPERRALRRTTCTSPEVIALFKY